MKHITAEWLKSAKSDLDTIEEILSNDQLSHVVAFHSQQCIEKTFKAIIEEHSVYGIVVGNALREFKKEMYNILILWRER